MWKGSSHLFVTKRVKLSHCHTFTIKTKSSGNTFSAAIVTTIAVRFLSFLIGFSILFPPWCFIDNASTRILQPVTVHSAVSFICGTQQGPLKIPGWSASTPFKVHCKLRTRSGLWALLCAVCKASSGQRVRSGWRFLNYWTYSFAVMSFLNCTPTLFLIPLTSHSKLSTDKTKVRSQLSSSSRTISCSSSFLNDELCSALW